jgi:hypothetical protein
MSGKILKLCEYRSTKRKHFLKRNQLVIDRFVKIFIEEVLIDELDTLEAYFSVFINGAENQNWDYSDYRSCFIDSMKQVLGKKIRSRLEKETWFDSVLLDEDVLFDRCLNALILGRRNIGQAE